MQESRLHVAPASPHLLQRNKDQRTNIQRVARRPVSLEPATMQTIKTDLAPYDPARVNAVMIEARRMRNEAMVSMLKNVGRFFKRLVGSGESQLPKGTASHA